MSLPGTWCWSIRPSQRPSHAASHWRSRSISPRSSGTSVQLDLGREVRCGTTSTQERPHRRVESPCGVFATAGRATGQTGGVQGSGGRLRLCHAPGGCAGRRRRNAHQARLRKIPGVGCAIGRPQRGPARAGRARADSRSPALSLWASRGAPSPRLRPSSSDRRAARPRARPGSR